MASFVQYVRRPNGEKISYTGHRQKMRRYHLCEKSGLVISRCAEAIHVWRLGDQQCLLAFPLSDPVGAVGYLSSDERWLILRDERSSAHQSETVFFVYELGAGTLEEVENFDIKGTPDAVGFTPDSAAFVLYGPAAGKDMRRRLTLKLSPKACIFEESLNSLRSDAAPQQRWAKGVEL